MVHESLIIINNNILISFVSSKVQTHYKIINTLYNYMYYTYLVFHNIHGKERSSYIRITRYISKYATKIHEQCLTKINT